MQPFLGPLIGLAVPTPQDFGLKEIPGDDGLHPYIAPKKTDVRGMCPTLNTMVSKGLLCALAIKANRTAGKSWIHLSQWYHYLC